MPTLKVSDEVREKLKRPLGRLVRTIPEALAKAEAARRGGHSIVVIGDRTTLNFVANGLIPDLSIIDGREMRGPAPRVDSRIFKNFYRVENPAGAINTDIVGVIVEGLSDPPSLIFVEGEEDLLGLLVCVTVDEGTSVFYGQPHEGIVMIDLTRDAKEIFRSIFEEIEVKHR